MDKSEIAKEVAQNVGHGSATLQKHYLIPEVNYPRLKAMGFKGQRSN